MKHALVASITVVAAFTAASSVAWAEPTVPAGQTIVINEAVTRGFVDPQDEYVEFQNVTDADIDVSDYRLRFTPPGKPSVRFARLPFGMSVAPGEFFLYMGFNYTGPFCFGPVGAFDIPDEGTISLHEPNGALVASIVVPQNPPPPLTPCS